MSKYDYKIASISSSTIESLHSVFILISFFLCASITAEEVNLSGTVSDKTDNPIKNAVVKLKSNNQISTTTSSAGQFNLTGKVSVILKNHAQSPIPFATLKGSVVSVNLVASSDIAISVYSMSGRKVYDFKSAQLKPGLNRIAMPFHTLGSGVYVVSVQHEGNRSAFRYFSIDQRGSGFASFSRKNEGSASVFQKTAADESDFIDSLVITANGYATKFYPLSSYIQENIEITLEESTSESGNFTENINGVTLDMVFVQGGTYQRGCDDCAAQDKQYETPVHDVTLSSFHISKFEVTQALWKAVMGDNSSSFGSSDNSPKIGVSWFEANEFMCRLNSMTGRNFRLPTDAEWEFAARGGNTGKNDDYRYSGSNNADDVAWHSGNSGNRSHEVGTKAPNQLGIYDMSGNAWEWVYDWLVAYTENAKTDPVQLTGTGNKTRRGGSYDEPSEFARVSRRAIRSRDGAAGMGFRIAHSNSLPPGMVNPCEAANPISSSCSGDKNRDCRLITEEGYVWAGDDNVVIIRENGAAAVSGFPTVSGEWYTLNDRSLNIVSTSGSKATSTYAYYVFSKDEMTMIGAEGMPYRLYKKPVSEITGNIPSLPNITNPTSLAQLIANVEPERMVSEAQLANPDTSVRDPRLIPDEGYTWFFDGNCCGGNHKYRFHLAADGNAEFVVMDYDDTHRENVLARGRWFTVGNIALHIIYNGKYYNYLYTTGNRSTSYGEYMPAGPIFSHISFQSYERGDFRIFNRTLYDDKIKRPKGFNGDKPVYDPGEYQTGSGGN
jgi:formylglycine-generating enzyme required for sulfatase activity